MERGGWAVKQVARAAFDINRPDSGCCPIQAPMENSMQDEASYTCDSCGEEIVVPIDATAGEEQEYVEDCPVCCCPNVIHVRIDGDHVEIWAEPE